MILSDISRLRHIICLMVLIIPGIASAVSQYSTLEVKANRFFDNREWRSADAMYQLMLDQQPKVASTYAHGVVAWGMLKDDNEQMAFVERSEKEGVPMDSVLNKANVIATTVNAPEVYEHLLILIKARQSWLTRYINTRLLDYYMFRKDAPKIIEVAKALLDADINDEKYMQILAQAYLMNNNNGEAIKCFESLLKSSPDNYDALLYLANYYTYEGDKRMELLLKDISTVEVGDMSKQEQRRNEIIHDCFDKALSYFVDVTDVKKNTPYVTEQIKRLVKINTFINLPMSDFIKQWNLLSQN